MDMEYREKKIQEAFDKERTEQEKLIIKDVGVNNGK